MSTSNKQLCLALPILKEDEIYAGALIAPDRKGYHLILLPGDNNIADWFMQLRWAKSIGGCLPNPAEQNWLYLHLIDQFKKACYWSSEEPIHASENTLFSEAFFENQSYFK